MDNQMTEYSGDDFASWANNEANFNSADLYKVRVSKEDFDKLWSINPIYDLKANEDHGLNATKELLESSLFIYRNEPTNDGQLLTFDLIYNRYKTYVTVKKILTEGTEHKFIRKEDRIVDLFTYIFDKMFMIDFQMPDTSRHYYFWADKSEKEITSHYNNFIRLCPKK